MSALAKTDPFSLVETERQLVLQDRESRRQDVVRRLEWARSRARPLHPEGIAKSLQESWGGTYDSRLAAVHTLLSSLRTEGVAIQHPDGAWSLAEGQPRGTVRVVGEGGRGASVATTERPVETASAVPTAAAPGPAAAVEEPDDGGSASSSTPLSQVAPLAPSQGETDAGSSGGDWAGTDGGAAAGDGAGGAAPEPAPAAQPAPADGLETPSTGGVAEELPGAKLRRLRLAAGISVRELAQRSAPEPRLAGSLETTIYNLERHPHKTSGHLPAIFETLARLSVDVARPGSVTGGEEKKEIGPDPHQVASLDPVEMLREVVGIPFDVHQLPADPHQPDPDPHQPTLPAASAREPSAGGDSRPAVGNAPGGLELPAPVRAAAPHAGSEPVPPVDGAIAPGRASLAHAEGGPRLSSSRSPAEDPHPGGVDVGNVPPVRADDTSRSPSLRQLLIEAAAELERQEEQLAVADSQVATIARLEARVAELEAEIARRDAAWAAWLAGAPGRTP